MAPWSFVLASLAVWRVTHLLHAEDGPWSVLVRLRAPLAGNELGKMVGCFYCLSIWVALPFAALGTGGGWALATVWPALSGVAILLERLTDRPPPAPFWHEPPPE
jgi:hypothetical protein